MKRNVKKNYEGAKAASYSRTACVQESKRGNEEQELAIEAFAKKHGMKLLPNHRYSDVGKSGMKKKNQGLLKLMRVIESGTCPFSSLIIKSPNRLSRNYKLENIEFFQRHGITLIFLNPAICLYPEDGTQELGKANFTTDKKAGE